MRILWIVSDVPTPAGVVFDEVRTAEFTPSAPQQCRACSASDVGHRWQVTDDAVTVACSEQGKYTPPRPGDRLDGMEWTGQSWAPICPACDVPMTEYNASAELYCLACRVSYIARMRAER